MPPIATNPAIGDGVLWTTLCKRGRSQSRSSEPRRGSIVASHHKWGHGTLDTHDAPLFAVGAFFFGEADFFSAKRLFLREARDVSGVRSNPPWAREGKN